MMDFRLGHSKEKHVKLSQTKPGRCEIENHPAPEWLKLFYPFLIQRLQTMLSSKWNRSSCRRLLQHRDGTLHCGCNLSCQPRNCQGVKREWIGVYEIVDLSFSARKNLWQMCFLETFEQMYIYIYECSVPVGQHKIRDWWCRPIPLTLTPLTIETNKQI